jgi:hypothetical protein
MNNQAKANVTKADHVTHADLKASIVSELKMANCPYSMKQITLIALGDTPSEFLQRTRDALLELIDDRQVVFFEAAGIQWFRLHSCAKVR